MLAFLAFLVFGCSLMPVHTAGQDSPTCIFPFVFDGKSYSSCTKDGVVDEQLWCSTTADYDRDGQWKYCFLQEHGGNSGGDSCIFPFIYKNRTFYTCTEEEKDGFWCATTRNYDRDLKWSYCADTRLDASPKGPCVFPFIYNHTSYSSCTTDGISNRKPWCSLTRNYDADLQWTYCEPSGAEEVVESPPCVFPLSYKGKLYSSCMVNGRRDGAFWCGITSNYDVDKKLKFCLDSGPDPMAESPTCLFPFTYKNESYSACTSEGMSDGKLWCATTSNYDIDKKWMYCNVTGPHESVESPPCVFPFIYNGKFYLSCTADGQKDGRFWCATTNSYDADKKWMFCQDSGPDPNIEGPSCIFPFIYKGESYNTCTTEGMRDGKCWCATTSSYDMDKKWMYCNVTGPDESVESPPCVFPFIYNGKSYLSCTADGWSDGSFWCATTNSYDADKKWKFCLEESGPDPKVESPSCVFPFTYKNNSYSTCTPDGMSDGEHWCATTDNYDADKKWMYCNITGPDTSKETPRCIFPFTYNGKNYSSCTEDGRRDKKLWCATTNNYDIDKKSVLCTITKTGCVFPFIYKGKAYQTCTTLDHNEGKAWCATTPDYQTGLKWRLCNQTDCVFPFVFRGKSYHSCTRAGRTDRQSWCSLTYNADTNMTWLLC